MLIAWSTQGSYNIEDLSFKDLGNISVIIFDF